MKTPLSVSGFPALTIFRFSPPRDPSHFSRCDRVFRSSCSLLRPVSLGLGPWNLGFLSSVPSVSSCKTDWVCPVSAFSFSACQLLPAQSFVTRSRQDAKDWQPRTTRTQKPKLFQPNWKLSPWLFVVWKLTDSSAAFPSFPISRFQDFPPAFRVVGVFCGQTDLPSFDHGFHGYPFQLSGFQLLASSVSIRVIRG